MRRARTIWLQVALVALAATPAVAQRIPTPASVLGFEPGADRKLVEWTRLVGYYQQLARASGRVQFREVGKTTLDAPFVALVISSEDNMRRLQELRDMNAKLADPRTLSSPAERAQIIRDGKAFVLITSSIHSTEVGGHLSPAVIAHRLASENTPGIRRILDNTVVLLVPSLNPDGVNIVSRWYNGNLGTPAETTSPPELYHHYVGHDNNRDWYAFTQVETQLTVDSLHNYWHPQIVHDIHQQGSFGSRFFVPPFLDPIEPNVDPLLVQGYNTLGTYMAWELTGQGKTGVVLSATYDAWTPARAYQHHHAGVRVLSETASARLATPIEVPFDRLQAGRNFDARVSSWNFPAPWPGGRWTLADIVDYQSSGAIALLQHAAANRELWLSNFVTVGERAVAGWKDWPYAFVIPADQANASGVNTALGILHRGMVEIRRAETPVVSQGRRAPAGSYIIELRQPYGSFAKALLERQSYPDLRLFPGGPPRPPYDVTAHTLPLLMGFETFALDTQGSLRVSDPIVPPAPEYRYPGLSSAAASDAPGRVGLYKSYRASMDEGWTRWIFDTWAIPYRSLMDEEIRGGNLRQRYDAIVIPDMSSDAIVNGLDAPYPPEYRGGIGREGVAALRSFVEGGGTLVVLNDASHFAIEAFGLPLVDAVADMNPQEFYAPGTLFKLEVDRSHPIAATMPATTAAWFQRSPAFSVTERTGTAVIARYPSNPREVLLSGWVLHPERVAGKAALIEVAVGDGRVVVFGFRPQYRAQSIATYPLLFNALRSR